MGWKRWCGILCYTRCFEAWIVSADPKQSEPEEQFDLPEQSQPLATLRAAPYHLYIARFNRPGLQGQEKIKSSCADRFCRLHQVIRSNGVAKLSQVKEMTAKRTGSGSVFVLFMEEGEEERERILVAYIHQDPLRKGPPLV
jgi:hypothetical protein